MAEDRRFGPFWRCIYCRNAGVSLTKEHPMPANIGGDIALRRAVCDDCKLRIEKFETPCLTWWTPVRFKRNMGRRRTGKRKNSLRLQVRLRPNKQLIVPMKNLHEQILEWTPLHVPYEQHPALIAMSFFKAPGFLRNLTPEQSSDDFANGIWQHADSVKPDDRYSEAKVGVHFDPVLFGRLVAKILVKSLLQNLEYMDLSRF